MIRDVYNNIALDDVSEQYVSYPKHVCVTRESALHCFVRDMSLSQHKILQIAIFEDPFFAHVDIKKACQAHQSDRVLIYSDLSTPKATQSV